MSKISKENKKYKKSYSKRNSKKKVKILYSNLNKSSQEEIIINFKNKNNSEKSKIKIGLRRGQWSLHEDKLLKEWITKNGSSNWEQCGRFIKSRNGKQCREHWIECLNPELIKGEWTTEEDFLIMHFYEKCNGSWKKIINLFNGRNKNSIKNRFYCQMRKIAGKDIPMDAKKNCPKIKLEELKNNLEKAINIAKNRFLKEKQMNEEELNIYINSMELKITKKYGKKTRYLDSSINTNLGKINSSNTYINNENKEDTFIKKRKRTIDKNLDANIKEEKDEEEENNIIDLVENNKNILNNNEISTNENNEFKFSFEKYININNINNENTSNNKEEENDNNNRNILSCNSNPFDIKFIDFLSPCDEFKITTICNRDDSYNNLEILDNNIIGYYNKKKIDYVDEKKDMDFSEREND